MEVRVVLAFAVDSWSPSETPPSPSCHIHTPQPSLHFSLLYLSIYTSFICVWCLRITSPFLNKYPLRFWEILELCQPSCLFELGFKVQVFGQTLPAGDFQCWNFCDFHVSSTIHGILAGNIQILVNPISSVVQDHVVSFQLSLIDRPVLSRYLVIRANHKLVSEDFFLKYPQWIRGTPFQWTHSVVQVLQHLQQEKSMELCLWSETGLLALPLRHYW